MQKIKKVPQRKCIACQERDSKKGLIRIVKNKENEVFIDLTGKANGRGAYIKKDVDVLKTAKDKKILERALETQINEAVYEEIETVITNI